LGFGLTNVRSLKQEKDGNHIHVVTLGESSIDLSKKSAGNAMEVLEKSWGKLVVDRGTFEPEKNPKGLCTTLD